MKSSNKAKASSSWQRNLYTATRHPDNFTPDDCFLAAIERNKNVNKYSLAQCVPSACQVSLQLCAVMLFQVRQCSIYGRRGDSRSWGHNCKLTTV